MLNDNLIKELKLNYKKYICENNFLGIGTCRIVYKIDNNLVLKIHLNDLGFKQSKVEHEIYHNPKFKKYKSILTKQLYCCKEFSICEYAKPLERYSDGCEIWCSDEIPFTYCLKQVDNFLMIY